MRKKNLLKQVQEWKGSQVLYRKIANIYQIKYYSFFLTKQSDIWSSEDSENKDKNR